MCNVRMKATRFHDLLLKRYPKLTNQKLNFDLKKKLPLKIQTSFVNFQLNEKHPLFTFIFTV